MDYLRLHFKLPSSGYFHPMPNLHRFTSIVTLRQYQPTVKLHRFTSIFKLQLNSKSLRTSSSTLHLNSTASLYLQCQHYTLTQPLPNTCVCVCVCVCTVRPAGRTVQTHTHHRFRITLPNTDQAHDKISVNHYE